MIDKLTIARNIINILLKIGSDLQKNEDPILKYLDRDALKADAIIRIDQAIQELNAVKSQLQP